MPTPRHRCRHHHRCVPKRENPGIVSIPLGFLGAWLGTILTARDVASEAKYAELSVRSNTGLGAEKATAH